MMCKSTVATFQADYGSMYFSLSLFFFFFLLCKSVLSPVLGEDGPRNT